MPLDYMRKNPLAAIHLSKPETEPIWNSIVSDMGANSVRVWAWRPFEAANEVRNLKLGTKRKWAIGFFNMQGLSAFSPTMELELETQESFRRKPTPKQLLQPKVKNLK